MATAAFSSPVVDAARKRRFGWLELALLVSLAALLVQLLGPASLRTWQQWPRPGRQVTIAPMVSAPDGRQWEARCWMFFPKDYTGSRRFPLLLFLHGAGERGDDLNLVLRYGLPGMLAGGKELPMLVLSPQCLPERNWENDELLALLDWAQAQYSIDPDHIYVSGFSMGGYGAWSLAAAAPDRFAAIVPVAGGGIPSDAERLARLPIWAFHGDGDKTVPLKASQEVVDAVQSLGGNVRLTILKGQGHGICNLVYSRPDLYDWLLAQQRSGQSSAQH